jgi:hypothetical protein
MTPRYYTFVKVSRSEGGKSSVLEVSAGSSVSFSSRKMFAPCLFATPKLPGVEKASDAATIYSGTP